MTKRLKSPNGPDISNCVLIKVNIYPMTGADAGLLEKGAYPPPHVNAEGAGKIVLVWTKAAQKNENQSAK